MKSLFMLKTVALTVLAFSVAAMADSPEAQKHPAFVCGGEPCEAVIRGSFAFSDRHLHGLKGNGRSCADCHMPQDEFQLSPASVEARFEIWNGAGSGIRARTIRCFARRCRRLSHQWRPGHDFSNLRQNGLIRVMLPLPSNVS